MNWVDQWFYRKVKYCWENKDEFEKQKGTSMKFFWRWVFNNIKTIGSEPVAEDSPRLVGATTSAHEHWGDGLNIRVNTAVGGKIVTFHRYERKSDRSNNNVYIIPDDQDFERELGKLITLESMRGS